jgi:hypothetical protein
MFFLQQADLFVSFNHPKQMGHSSHSSCNLLTALGHLGAMCLIWTNLLTAASGHGQEGYVPLER